MQKTLIIGNLGGDAELKEHNGRQFVSFSVAETSKRKTANGDVLESKTWYECTMNYGNVFPYLKKGTQVMVIGRSYATAYLAEKGEHQGEVMVKMKCTVQELTLLGSANNGQQAAQQPAQAPAAPTPQAQYPYAQQAVQQPQQATMQMPPDGDDDLPF